MWKKYIIKIITIIGSFLLGVVLREGLSSRIITEKLLEKDMITNINYIYTFGIKEIITVLVFTGLVYVCFYIKYIESKVSLSEINKTFFKILHIELLIFAFTTGTCLGNILDKVTILLMFGIIVLVLEVIFSIERSYKLEAEEDENRKELYKSREDLLERLKTYLKNMDAVAITGAWGIGKTVFLNEFFYRAENGDNAEKKYEKIYIDVSIFTENKRIIEKIERDLNNIFEKYGILKIKDKLLTGLEENNSWCKSILNFFKLEVENKNQNLEKKIKELETKNKSIVLCLDNFERISDKNRIISLLAIIDERIPKGIKRVYLYDEEYMEELFSGVKKANEILDESLYSKGFKEYFNKYIEHSFSIKDAKIEEILARSPDLKKVIDRITSRIDSFEKKLKFKANLLKNNQKEKEENSKNSDAKIQIINNFIEISLNFKKLLLVPRYLEQLKNFIGKIEEKNKVYELEWKIISDCFKNVSAKKLEENSFNDMDYVIDENKIDKNIIFLRYLFFTENTGNNYDRLKVYKNEKKDKYELEIEKIEKNIQGRLTEGLSLIKDRYSNSKRIYKYNEFLEKGFSNLNEYIINSSKELSSLVLDYKNEIDKIDYFFLEKIVLDENGIYKDGEKETSVIDYRETIIKLYLKYNKNIQILLQFILSIKESEVAFDNLEKNLKEKLKVDFLKEIIKKLRMRAEGLEEELKQVYLTVDEVKNSLIFAEKILDLPVEAKSEKKKKAIPEEYFENKTRKELLLGLESSYDELNNEFKLDFDGLLEKEFIILNKDNATDYREELQDNLNKEADENKIELKIFLLIELIKLEKGIK
ncbi:MAG: hypothetical protein Q7K47_06850 [Fusobacterium sp. JB019]|nr:hypothetical protein [Fusobacterium sp. JB019]